MSNLKLQITAVFVIIVLVAVASNHIFDGSNTQASKLIYYSVVSLIFVFFSLFYPTNILKHIKISQNSIKTTAQITKINSTISGMCNAKVTYSDNNKQYTQNVTITYFAYKNKYRIGDTVKVYYNKNNPELVMFAGMNLFMEFVNKHYEYRIAFDIILCTLFSLVVFGGLLNHKFPK